MTTKEKKITEIVPVEDKVIATQTLDPAQQVEFAQKAAKALMTVIDATKPLTMQGKRYLYFEHWQTVARFFNTTVGIIETTKDVNGYIAKAAVYDKNGTIIGGAEASCMKDEANWRTKPDFQLRSMAQTRAMAKALRSIYGFVAVLAGVEATPAEEMADTTPTAQNFAPSTRINPTPIQVTPAQQQREDFKSVAPRPQATPRQRKLILDLCKQKGVTPAQLKELVIDYTPSDLIKHLMSRTK